MSRFIRSAFTVMAASLLLGSPVLVGAASAQDCERSTRTQADVPRQSRAALQALEDRGYQIHDIDGEDGEVNIEARRGGEEVDVNFEPAANGQVEIEVEVDRGRQKGERSRATGEDASACRAAEEILARITSG